MPAFWLKSVEKANIFAFKHDFFDKILKNLLTYDTTCAIIILEITPIITIGAFFIVVFRGGSSSRVYAA